MHHLLYVTLLLLYDVKTDDRFILKQMPRLEVQSFLDFAPHYFTYIINAVQQKVFKKSAFSFRQRSVFYRLVTVSINVFHLSKRKC